VTEQPEAPALARQLTEAADRHRENLLYTAPEFYGERWDQFREQLRDIADDFEPAPAPAEAGAAGQLRQRPGDQQLPVPNDGPSMHDLAAEDVRRRHPGGRAPEIHAVVRDLAARKQLGLDRYGNLLQAHNGRDVLRDLSEELLDAIVYCKQWLEEAGEEHPYAVVMRREYQNLLTGVLTVRRVIGTGEEAPLPPANAAAKVTVSLECGHEGWIYSDETACKLAWCGACETLRAFTPAREVGTGEKS